MEFNFLLTLIESYPFSYEQIKLFYDHYKSYDLLIAACEYNANIGSGILLLPPMDLPRCPHCGGALVEHQLPEEIIYKVPA